MTDIPAMILMIAELKSRVEELETALKPFVDASNAFDIKDHWPKDAVEEVLVTVADLRAARAALGEKE